jgi:photoprotection regulator FRP-like protein
MASDEWSKGEKTIARRAFDLAYERECAALADKVRHMADRIAGPGDIWEIHDFLRGKRKAIDQKYDYRYSVLIFVFARLLGEGWLEESELAGLSDDKLAKIQSLAGMADQRS